MLRTLSSLLIAALLSLGIARPAAAAAAPGRDAQQPGTAVVALRDRLTPLGTGPDARIELRQRDGSKLKGYVVHLGETALSIRDESGVTTQVPYDDITKVRGHNLATGWKIAIGGAIGVGVFILVLYIYLTTHSD